MIGYRVWDSVDWRTGNIITHYGGAMGDQITGNVYKNWLPIVGGLGLIAYFIYKRSH